MSLRRGDLHRVDMGPIGEKFAMVVSNDEIQRVLRQPIICMVTSNDRYRSLDTYVVVEPPEAGLTKRSFVLCHSVFTVEEWRIADEPVGTFASMTVEAVGEKLATVFALT